MSESAIQARVRAILSHRDSPARVWRNNIGVTPVTYIKYGLGVGSADLVGIYQRTISEDMVGQVIGQFLGVEVKTPIGRLSKEQKAWIKTIQGFGGIAEVCRSEQDAINLLKRLG